MTLDKSSFFFLKMIYSIHN